jgi:TRAP-type uncharacterized transport system substrate-binding protein
MLKKVSQIITRIQSNSEKLATNIKALTLRFSLLKRRKQGKIILILTVISILFGVGIYLLSTTEYSSLKKVDKLRASKIPKGNYEKVIHHVCKKLNQKSIDGTLDTCINLMEIETNGSRQTMNQIIQDSVDIGIIQSNAPIKNKYCGVIAKLYDEYFILFSRDSSVKYASNILAFQNKINRKIRIGALGLGSQTNEDLKTLLEYYGITENLYDIVPCRYNESYEYLMNGNIDFSFYITSKSNENVVSTAKSHLGFFVQFDNPEMLNGHYQNAHLITIHKGELRDGIPKFDYKTIAVSALLVGATNRNNITVYNLTKKLFDNTNDINNGLPYLKVTPIDTLSNLPIHPGTKEYFNKSSPFWVQYEGLIKIFAGALTLILGVIGVFIEFKKIKKEI